MASETGLQEVEIPFNGRTFRVRPEYRILARIEAVTGAPCRETGIRCYASGLPFSQRNGVKELGLAEVATVLSVLLEGQKDAPPTGEIGPILVQDGYIELMGPLGDFLTRAARGNKVYEQEMREKAELAEKEGTAAAADKDPPTSQG